MRLESSISFKEDNKLSSTEIERFKQLMMGDRIIIGADEFIESVKTEKDLLGCLIYLWQQQSFSFRKNLPKEVKDWFLTKFKPSNRSYYKGMHFKPGTSLSNLTLDLVEFTSVTEDYDVALEFANGPSNFYKNEGFICAIYEVNGIRVFSDVDSCRDMEERESILTNPSFKLLEILN